MIKNKRLYLLGLAFFGAGLLDAFNLDSIKAGPSAEIIAADSYTQDLITTTITSEALTHLAAILKYANTSPSATLPTNVPPAIKNLFDQYRPISASISSLLKAKIGDKELSTFAEGVVSIENRYFTAQYRESKRDFYRIGGSGNPSKVDAILTTALESEDIIVLECALSSLPLILQDMDEIVASPSSIKHRILYSDLLTHLTDVKNPAASATDDAAKPGKESPAGAVAALSDTSIIALDSWLQELYKVSNPSNTPALLAALKSTDGTLKAILDRKYTNSVDLTKFAIAVLEQTWNITLPDATLPQIQEEIKVEQKVEAEYKGRPAQTINGVPTNGRFVLFIHRTKEKFGKSEGIVHRIGILPLVGFSKPISLYQILSQFNITQNGANFQLSLNTDSTAITKTSPGISSSRAPSPAASRTLSPSRFAPVRAAGAAAAALTTWAGGSSSSTTPPLSVAATSPSAASSVPDLQPASATRGRPPSSR